jgi:hypothetical protein
MVVTVDLLKGHLDRYKGSDMIQGAYGSTDIAGLKAGREFERLAGGYNQANTGGRYRRASESGYKPLSESVGDRRLELERNLRRAAGMTSKRIYEPSRLSNIHSRTPKTPRGIRRSL